MSDEKTTQEQLADIAREYGWRVVEVSGRAPHTFRYKRADTVITVVYTKIGTIKEISHERPGLTLRSDRNEKGKYALVDKWLRHP